MKMMRRMKGGKRPTKLCQKGRIKPTQFHRVSFMALNGTKSPKLCQFPF